MALGVILGSSFLRSPLFESFQQRIVETKYGNVKVMEGTFGKQKVVIIRRHQCNPDKDYVQPHAINYRAMISAFKQCGCEHILGFYSVGALKTNITIGTIVVPDDYAYLAAPPYFSDEYSAHFVPSLDMETRSKIISILKEHKTNFVDSGSYFQTIGPRFETKAEINMYKNFFDIVGMTGASEATLAQEIGMPLSMVCIVDNMGHGLGDELTFESFQRLQQQNKVILEEVIDVILNGLCGVA